MPVTPRKIIRTAGRPLIRKAAGRPVGIWIFWACLAYAANSFAPELFYSASHKGMGTPMLSQIVAVWVPIVTAAIGLCMRRRIAQLFGGISMAFLLHHSVTHTDYSGMALSLLGLAGLLANRRWFYERLPNIEK